MKKSAAAGMIALALSLFATSAGAAPTVTITSPDAGATFSRATSPKISLTGEASFDTPAPIEQKFYLRHGPCSNASTDERSLKTSWSNSDVESCGYNGTVTPLNEVIYQVDGPGAALSEAYPVDPSQLPVTLDATKPITGVLDVGTDGLNNLRVGVGLTTIDFTLQGTVNGTLQTIGTASANYQELPGPGPLHKQVTWSITPPASLDKKDLTTLDLIYSIHGVNVQHGWVYFRGLSHVTIPSYTTSFTRKVEVAVDGSAFSATPVTLSADQTTWTALINTPAVGTRTLKARSVQGGAVSGVATRAITVTA
jgi:hypothetical protein